jgi:hypothetical protein
VFAKRGHISLKPANAERIYHEQNLGERHENKPAVQENYLPS